MHDWWLIGRDVSIDVHGTDSLQLSVSRQLLTQTAIDNLSTLRRVRGLNKSSAADAKGVTGNGHTEGFTAEGSVQYRGLVLPVRQLSLSRTQYSAHWTD